MNQFKTIYCDFDGTISKIDTVNSFFSRFASSDWLSVEQEWIDKKIGSRECLTRQLELVSGLEEPLLLEFLDSIDIDDGFKGFYNYLKDSGREIVVLSDGFDFFIKRILFNHGFSNIKVCSNNFKIIDNKFFVSFDNTPAGYTCNAGTCKCSKIVGDKFLYIGDGLSDVCVAQKASILYAKNSLAKYCDNIGLVYKKFSTFSDIVEDLRKGDLNATACSGNQ